MIRIATPADLDAITVLHAEARATYYAGHLPESEYAGPEELARSREGWASAVDRGGVLCAVLGDELVGVAAYAERGAAVVLTQFHVSPAHWRKGMGRQLHTGCVDVWHAHQATHATLEVFEKNERALAFYAAQDWVPDPDTPRSGDHLVLRLTLTAEPE